MSISSSVIEKRISCPRCGNPIKIPEKSAVITCESCDCEYNYKPEIKFSSYLKFTCDNGEEYLYEIPGSVIVGKNNRGIITIYDQVLTSLTENVPIRTPYVNGRHLKIDQTTRYEIIDLDGEKFIVNWPMCTIKDNNTKNGTEVNRQRLTADQMEKLLRHGDRIILAPGCRKYVEIEYIMKRKK